MGSIDEQFILHEEALDDLYAWIDGIPFSRPKKNIARDFSDGVLCAELIAHFQPKNVDMHNYFPASSAMQKKINWSTLNRKVFSKMGIRLSDSTIQQLIEAKPGAIEQVLWDIRRKIMSETSSGRQEYRQRRGDGRSEGTGNRSRSVGSPYENEITAGSLLGYRNSVHEQQDFSDEPPLTVLRGASKIPMGGPSQGPYKAPPTAPTSTSYGGSYTNSYQNQGYIAAPAKPTPSNVNTEPSNNNPSVPPSQIIYRGHKMVPLALLEEREREIKSLEQANKTLVTKGGRIDTLVQVKDQRIEDLTHQIHNLRTLYERVTQQTWTGY